MDNHQNTSNHAESQLSIGQTVEVLVREFPDVTVSSLRFLESEGLISPVRNTGGHRVFSQQDVLRIRRIKQLQADRVPLKEIRKRMQRSLAVRDLESVVEEVTSLLLDGNIAEAVIRLEDVHLADTPLLTLFDDVLTPVLRNLGDEEGNHLIPVDMQFEFDEQLISLIARITVMPAQILGQPVVLAACPPWERHDLPLRMLVALLKERGASVHFIGAQVARAAYATNAGGTGILRLVVHWAISFIQIALIVRVLGSWFGQTRFSRWTGWSYKLTDWIVEPLRRVIPNIGMIDITPIVAYFALALLRGILLSVI